MKKYLKKYRDAEFKYGTLDCCLFVANVIRDMKGIDYAEQWRGKYKSEIGAARMVAEFGGMAGLASHAFGQIKPIWAVKAGDPVLLSSELVEHDSIAEGLGIFDGNFIVYLTEKGLSEAPITMGRGCWNV